MRCTFQRRRAVEIWSIFRRTSRCLVQRPMHAKAGIASAMAFAAAALCAPQEAQAYTVLATITGTLTSGSDVTGVFVGKKADLTGYPYTATFTFDTTQGTNSPVLPTQCYNGLHNSGTNTPVSQVELTINGSSYVFSHTPTAPSIDSFVYAQNAGSSKAGLGFYFSETFNSSTGFTGGNNIGTEITINSLSTALCRYWYNAFSYTLKPPTDGYTGGSGFLINKYQIVNGVSKQYQVATGYFSVNTVSVSGTITPQSSPHIYFLNVSTGQYSDITNSSVPVVLGQPIELFAIPAGTPAQPSAWDVQGTPVGAYLLFPQQTVAPNVPTGPPPPCVQIVATSGCANAEVSLPDFSQGSTTFYWYVPGTYQVTYASSLGSASATFGVSGPTGVHVTTTVPGPAALGAAGTKYANGVYYGQPWIPLPGVTTSATATPPTLNVGEFHWVQLISSDSEVFQYPDGHANVQSLCTGLDNYFYYPISPTTAPIIPNNAIADSPRATLINTASRITRSVGAQTFLLWKPTMMPNSIPVPLGYAGWQITFGASQASSGTWTPFGSGSPLSFASTPVYPTWSSVVINGSSSCP
jgi:hypothetical protein